MRQRVRDISRKRRWLVVAIVVPVVLAADVAVAILLDSIGVPTPWSTTLSLAPMWVLLPFAVAFLRAGITGGQPEFYLRRATDSHWLHGHGHGEPGVLHFQPYSDKGLHLRLPTGPELALPVDFLDLDHPQKLPLRDIWWNGDFRFRSASATGAGQKFEIAAFPVILRRLEEQTRSSSFD